MTEPIPEAEAFINFKLSEMSPRNEHHEFEEIATRIARKRQQPVGLLHVEEGGR